MKISQIILTVSFSSMFALMAENSHSQNHESLLSSAALLKQYHVLRSFESCRAQGNSEAHCKSELNYLHSRELSALQRIVIYSKNYDEHVVSRATTDCYRPKYDYKELIECWEGVADRMEIGADSIITTYENKSRNHDNSEFIKKLTEFERKSLLLCIRGKIDKNYRETVAHNFKKGGDDALWAMKIYAAESYLMADLASKIHWIEFQSYYKGEMNNMTRLIRGEINFSKYQLISKENEIYLEEILQDEKRLIHEHARNFEKFKTPCHEMALKIVAKSKAAASAE